MAKKEPNDAAAIATELLDAYNAVANGEATDEQLLKVCLNGDAIRRYLESRQGFEWRVGKQAADDMNRAAADYEQYFRVVAAERCRSLLNAATRTGMAEEAFVSLMLEGFIHGYSLRASTDQSKKRNCGNAGARRNAEKAEARGRHIIAAYDATDPSLSEAERYAAVRDAVKVSDETIRKALRSR